MSHSAPIQPDPCATGGKRPVRPTNRRNGQKRRRMAGIKDDGGGAKQQELLRPKRD